MVTIYINIFIICREGGEGLIEIILGAISRSGQPKSC